MSLLTNPWFTAGMGLLANSGPSLTPVNPWRGIGQDLMAANEAKAMEAQQAYEQHRMAVEQQKLEQEQQRQAQMHSIIQGLPPDQQQLAMADPNAFFEARIKQQFAAPADANLPAGWQMGPNGQAMMIPGYQPDTPADPTSIREFERAQQDPAFADYQQRMKAAGAMKIEMGAGDRASPSDVANMIYPDSSPVLPGTPWPEIIAKGGRTLTGEEKAARTATGTQGAKDEQAAAKGGNLFDNYTTAAGAYQSGVMPAGEAREQAKVARRALVTWYAKNVLGTPGAEPSPSLYDKAEEIIPDFAGPWDTAMFSARMEEIKQTIGASLGGKKQDQGMKDIELIYDPVLKRLVPAK